MTPLKDKEEAFNEALVACYRRGTRISRHALFRQGHVRKYKRLCYLEAANSTKRSSGQGSDCGDASLEVVNGNGAPKNRNVRNYVDHSSVHPYARSNLLHNVFYSWPSSVELLSSDYKVKWKLNIESPHCPFCKSKGTVDNPKQLVDHLETHHPEFTYEVDRKNYAKRVRIKLKVNKKRDDSVDAMMVVETEGCFVSTRIRNLYPNYCPPAQPTNHGFPFAIIFPAIPRDYGFLPGAPGTVDVNPTDAITPSSNDRSLYLSVPLAVARLPKQDGPKSKPTSDKAESDESQPVRRRKSRRVEGQPSDTDQAIAFMDIHPTPSVNVEDATAIARSEDENAMAPSPIARNADKDTLAMSPIARSHEEELAISASPPNPGVTNSLVDQHVTDNAPPSVTPSVDVEKKRELCARKSLPIKTAICRSPPFKRKRSVDDETEGMDNHHTEHFRSSMFGDSAHVPSAGKGCDPMISREAARGRLFRSVTNVPVDASQFNAGCDSDLEDDGVEASRRVVPAHEKMVFIGGGLVTVGMFMNLWNRFVQKEFTIKSDAGVFPAWLAFVAKYADLVKTMRLQVAMVKTLQECFSHGLLDADGMSSVMRAFRNNSKVIKHVSEYELLQPERRIHIARQVTTEDMYKNGISEKQSSNKGGTDEAPTIEEWASEQRMNLSTSKTSELEKRANSNVEGWMEEVALNEKAIKKKAVAKFDTK